MRTVKKTPNKKKYLIGIACGLLILAASLGAWYFLSHKDEIKRNDKGVSIERTPEDKKLEEQLNSNPSGKQEATQTDHPEAPTVDKTTNLQKANVILTSVNISNGKVNSSGFVSNIVENEGRCTYVYTKGETVVTKESNTLTNPSSTTCRAVQFESGELTPGEWKVQLIYESSTSYGKSNEMKVTVS